MAVPATPAATRHDRPRPETFEPSASDGVPPGLRSLGEVSRDPRVDDRARARLVEVTNALSVDLAWLGTALAEACDRGVSPAREAASHLVSGGGKRVRPVATIL